MNTVDLRIPWTDVDNTASPQLMVSMMDAFNNTAWLKTHKAKALQALAALPHGNYLEVGCGTGADAQALALQLGKDGQVTGLDSSNTMVDEATRRAALLALPLSFQCGDSYSLPFADHTFDGTYSLVTFDILQYPAAALNEMVRVTKPGGTVLVGASDHGTLVIDAQDRQLTRRLLEFFCDNTYSGWIGRQLPRYFTQAGLSNIKVQPDTVALQSPDYPVVKQILLENIVAGAQASGLISQTQGKQWLAELDASYASRSFFASSTFFIVSGVKAF
jgi:ubiquinone/menaquinone biosynthesis C-methylase UbiE